jgi:hypothetical protein
LQEQGIDSYDDLAKKAYAVSGEYHSRGDRFRAIEAEQKSIAELQKQIGNYGKYREVYSAYIKSGKDSAFYEANRMEITLCEAAKRYFDAQGLKTKLPSVNSLKQQWATLDAERKKLYSGYKELKENHVALNTAHRNAQMILNEPQEPPRRTLTHDYGER